MPQAVFVVDASMVLAWRFADEGDDYTEAVLGSFCEARAIAPIIWPLEIANVLVVAERRGRLTPAGSAQFLALVDQLPISVEVETK